MQTTFAEIPEALWERVERWIPKHSKSRKGGLGTKRHVVSDGRGVVLGVTLTGANVHDKYRSQVACSFTGLITPTASVPAPERGHVPGRDHEHEHEHHRF